MRIIPSSILMPCSIPYEEKLDKNHDAYICFTGKLQRFVSYFGKIQVVGAPRKLWAYTAWHTFEHLMLVKSTKFDLKRGVHLFYYRRCKNSVKVEGKVEETPKELFIYSFLSFGDLFGLSVLSFGQITKLLAEITLHKT